MKTTVRTARYAKAECVFACPPARSPGDDAFVSFLTLSTGIPSVFAPQAPAKPVAVDILGEVAARDPSLWHLFDRRGRHRASLSPADMTKRYEILPNGLFFMAAPRELAGFDVEAVLEGHEGTFRAGGPLSRAPTDVFGGLVRLDGSDRPICPADLPLSLQTAVLIGRDGTALTHRFHVEMLWHLMRRGVISSHRAWADMKATADLIGRPSLVTAPGGADPVAVAAVTARAALIEVEGRAVVPPLVPPPPAWERR